MSDYKGTSNKINEINELTNASVQLCEKAHQLLLNHDESDMLIWKILIADIEQHINKAEQLDVNGITKQVVHQQVVTLETERENLLRVYRAMQERNEAKIQETTIDSTALFAKVAGALGGKHEEK